VPVLILAAELDPSADQMVRALNDRGAHVHRIDFAIHASTEASRQDFRRDYRALRYERVDIPEHVANGVGKMMKSLGLLYAAIDFVVDVEECWVFIGDINPGGQYGWLEDATGAPLTTSLADLLTHQDTHQ
jgi:hypothetical protein